MHDWKSDEYSIATMITITDIASGETFTGDLEHGADWLLECYRDSDQYEDAVDAANELRRGDVNKAVQSLATASFERVDDIRFITARIADDRVTISYPNGSMKTVTVEPSEDSEPYELAVREVIGDRRFVWDRERN